ncbi:hypothetical protein EIK77_005215 [Talaromyces pinophilus]|nr:hypothetical protein EIK77_005215 [Talaromyces pinophilus]
MKKFLSLTKQAISLVDDDHDAAFPEDDDDDDSPAREAGVKGNLDIRAHLYLKSTPPTVPQEERERPTRQTLSYPSQDRQPGPRTAQAYPLLPHISLGNIIKAGESGFTQRLSLACMKIGYACLNDPAPNSEEMKQRLSLPLRVVTRQRLRDIFGLSLRMGHSYDASGVVTLPFFTLGGAGSHYFDYRRDYIPENPSAQSGLINGTTDQSTGYGMGDIWFDCYDVEGYLKENGVIPISGLPSIIQPPSYSGSLEGSRGVMRDNRFQSISVQNVLLHVPTNKHVDEGVLIGCKSFRCHLY